MKTSLAFAIAVMLIYEDNIYCSGQLVCNIASTLNGFLPISPLAISSTIIVTQTTGIVQFVNKQSLFDRQDIACDWTDLYCTAVLNQDIQYNPIGSTVTADYDSSTTQSSSLGFLADAFQNNIRMDLDQITYSQSFTSLEIRVICYHQTVTDKANAVISEPFTIQYTHTATNTAACNPTFSISDSDIQALTQTISLDALNPFVLFSSFSEYTAESCVTYADITCYQGILQFTKFVGDGTTGALSFNRNEEQSQVLTLRICEDSTKQNCVSSSVTFTITISSCDSTLAQASVVTNPSDLSSLVTRYPIDGNQPVSVGQWITQGLSNQFGSLYNLTCLSLIQQQCSSYISFLPWTTNPFIFQQDVAQAHQTIFTAATDFTQTSNNILCPLAYFEMTIEGSGNSSQFILTQTGSTAGYIRTYIDTCQSTSFTIKACSTTSPSANNCTVSSSLTVTVQNLQCDLLDRTYLPSSAETVNYKDFILNGTNMMIYKASYVNQLSNYEVDSSLFFTSDCQLTDFEIISIWNTTNGQYIAKECYSSIIKLNTASGVISFQKFNQPIDCFITIRAYNGQSWSSSAVNPQIRFVLQDIVVPVLSFNTSVYQNQSNKTNSTFQEIYLLNPWKPQCPSMRIELNEPSDLDYVCNLPEFKSQFEQQKLKLEINNLIPAMKFVENQRKILIVEKELQIDDIKQHFLEAKISDQYDNEEVYVIVIIIGLRQQIDQNDQIYNQTSKGEKLMAKIKSISSLGLVTLQFSSIINNLTLSDINSTVFNIYVQSALNDSNDDQNLMNLNKSNITWKAIDQSKREIMIQLIIKDPISISPLMKQDKLIIQLIHPKYAQLFFSPVLNQYLHQDSWTLIDFIRRQLPINPVIIQMIDSTEDLKDIMFVFLALSIILYLMSQGGLAMRYMFITVRSLQMIMHLPMVQISFPANAITLISILIPVVGFDILEVILNWEMVNEWFEIFNFQEHEFVGERLFAQLIDIGYETFNSIMILNTIGVILIMYLIKTLCIILMFFTAFLLDNKWLKVKVQQWSKGLFFNQLISLYIQGYIEFVIAAYLTTYLWDTKLIGEATSIGISCFTFFIACLFLPAASVYIICQKHEKLIDNDFKERWSQLYENMYETRKDLGARFFYLIFMLRRFTFIAMCFELRNSHLIFQLFIVDSMNLFVLIYQGQYRPALNKFENNLELFNEFLVTCCSLLIITFTDWIGSQKQIYFNGWLFCTLVLIQVFMNTILVFYFTFRRIYLICKKYYALFMHKHFNRRKRKQTGRSKNVKSKNVLQSSKGQEKNNISKNKNSEHKDVNIVQKNKKKLDKRIKDFQKIQKSRKQKEIEKSKSLPTYKRSQSQLIKQDEKSLDQVIQKQQVEQIMTNNDQDVQIKNKNNSRVRRSVRIENTQQLGQIDLGINMQRKYEQQMRDQNQKQGKQDQGKNPWKKKRFIQGAYYIPNDLLSVVTENDLEQNEDKMEQ